MNRFTTPLFATVLLASSPILATAAFSQAIDMKMVESEVSSDLAMMGINDIDVKMLTLQQLQDIKLIESTNGSNAEKKLQIEKIVSVQPGAKIE